MFKRLFFAFPLVASSVVLWSCSGDSEGCDGKSQVHAGSLAITGEEDSAERADLRCIQVITGDLTVQNSETVESLESLRSLLQVLGDVEIGGPASGAKNERLSSLHGLEQLTEIGGDLRISHLPKLASVEALSSLRQVGGDLSLYSLPLLSNVDGLDLLESIGGSLMISDNDKLTTLESFHALYHIEEDFLLQSNPRLTSIGFSSDYGPSAGGRISIAVNDALQTLTQFGEPQANDAPCNLARPDVEVFHNVSLEELVLPPVTDGCVAVRGNPKLTTLDGAGQLFSSGSISLESLPNLKSLDLNGWNLDTLTISHTGLETLHDIGWTRVNCELFINGNPELRDVTALDNAIIFAAASFWVGDNPVLPKCQVQPLVDDLPVTGFQCLSGYGSNLTSGTRRVDINGNDEAALCN